MSYEIDEGGVYGRELDDEVGGLHERRHKGGAEEVRGEEEDSATSVEILLQEESDTLGAIGGHSMELGEWEVKWQLVWTFASFLLPALLWNEDVATLFLEEDCFTSTTCYCDNVVLFSLFLLVLICAGAVLAGLGAAHSTRSLQGTGWSLREHARLVDAGEEALGPLSASTEPRVKGAANWIGEQLSAKKGTLERVAPTVLKVGLVVVPTIPLVALAVYGILHTSELKTVGLFTLGCVLLMLPVIICAVAMLRKGMALTFLTVLFFVPLPVMVVIDVAISTDSLWFAILLVGGCLLLLAAGWFFRNVLGSWLQQGHSVLASRGRLLALFMLALMPAGAIFETSAGGGRRHALLMASSYGALAQFAAFLVAVIVFAGFPLRTCLLTKELVAVALISCIAIACLALVNAVLRALPHPSRRQRAS